MEIEGKVDYNKLLELATETENVKQEIINSDSIVNPLSDEYKKLNKQRESSDKKSAYYKVKEQEAMEKIDQIKAVHEKNRKLKDKIKNKIKREKNRIKATLEQKSEQIIECQEIIERNSKNIEEFRQLIERDIINGISYDDQIQQNRMRRIEKLQEEISKSDLSIKMMKAIIAENENIIHLLDYDTMEELKDVISHIDIPKPEGPKPEGPKPEGPQPEGPKPEGPKPEGPKPEGPQPEGPQPEGPQPEGPQPEGPEPEDPEPKNKKENIFVKFFKKLFNLIFKKAPLFLAKGSYKVIKGIKDSKGVTYISNTKVLQKIKDLNERIKTEAETEMAIKNQAKNQAENIINSDEIEIGPLGRVVKTKKEERKEFIENMPKTTQKEQNTQRMLSEEEKEQVRAAAERYKKQNPQEKVDKILKEEEKKRAEEISYEKVEGEILSPEEEKEIYGGR